MAASSIFLPKILKEEADALVRKGYYSSRSDVFKNALRFLMQNKADLRVAAAIEMFKEKRISLGKAAELAGVSVIEFKDILADRGVISSWYSSWAACRVASGRWKSRIWYKYRIRLVRFSAEMSISITSKLWLVMRKTNV